MGNSNMEDEMRRFEMELAGTAQPQYGPGPPPPSLQQHGPPMPSQPFYGQGPSMPSAPARFIPHQLMRGSPATRPQLPQYMVHAGPQPAYPFQPPVFQPIMAPPLYAPRVLTQPTTSSTSFASSSTSFGSSSAFGSFGSASSASTSANQRQPAQNTLQVSANKAMLDAQKAMAMQTKEPPVMGPQITPKSLEDKALSNKAKKKIKYIRTAGGEVWEDSSLAEWDPNDFRIFCGDLGNEVNDEALARAFRKYPSFQKAKIIRDKKSNKSKGYGFVSFKDPNDFVRAMKEMNGKYVGNRPIKLRKSQWKERQLNVAKKRVREKQKLGMRT